jgi:hypothetical protein
MKRQAAQAVTCARCAAVLALDVEHCGICWWPVNATIATDPGEQSEAVETVVEPDDVTEIAQADEAPQHHVVVTDEVVEPADDYITEQIPVVLVAAAEVNGRPAQVWAPLPGAPLPGPNPFGTTFTG